MVFMVVPCSVTVALSRSTFSDSASFTLHLIAADIIVLIMRLKVAELTRGPRGKRIPEDAVMLREMLNAVVSPLNLVLARSTRWKVYVKKTRGRGARCTGGHRGAQPRVKS